jgi:apolipoprotein D and lipocalin family protein
MPLHALVFRGLLHRIAQRAVRNTARADLSRFTYSSIASFAPVAATTLQSAAAQAQTPVRTVPFVDLDRYLGDWFEIARFPNRFQRACVGDVRATYARRPDGRLDVANRCRTAEGETEARGVARIVDVRAFAKLKVRFAPSWLSWLPMVWGDYWIIGLAPDYAWAVVGEPGRNYLWTRPRAATGRRIDRAALGGARQRI